MLFAETGENLLFGFGVHLKAEGCVFFHKTCNGGSSLAVVAFALGVCSHSEARSRELGLFEGNNAFRVAESVAGGCFCKLGNSADVACGDAVNRFLSFAVHKYEFSKALLAAGSGIDRGCCGGKSAGDNFYERKLANERVGNGFEYIRCKRSICFAFYKNFLALGIGSNFRSGFCCGWEYFLDGGHKELYAFKGKRIAAIYGGDGTVFKAGFKTPNSFFLGEGFISEEFFHKLVSSVGNGFVHCRANFFKAVVGRHINFACFALCVKFKCLFCDHVYINIANRNGYRADAIAEFAFQAFKCFIEIGVFLIHFRNEKRFCFFSFGCKLPSFFSADKHAGFCGKSNDYCVSGAYSFVESAGKVKQSGSVDYVYLNAVVLKRSNSGGNGNFTFNFFRVKVANGIAVGNVAKTVGSAGNIKHCLRQRSFTIRTVTRKGNVSDIFSCVLFQSK